MVETCTPPYNPVATGVSLEDYLDHYAAIYHEWVNDAVITLKPFTWR